MSKYLYISIFAIIGEWILVILRVYEFLHVQDYGEGQYSHFLNQYFGYLFFTLTIIASGGLLLHIKYGGNS